MQMPRLLHRPRICARSVGYSHFQRLLECSEKNVWKIQNLHFSPNFPISPDFGSPRHFFPNTLKVVGSGYISVCAPKSEAYEVAEAFASDEFFLIELKHLLFSLI